MRIVYPNEADARVSTFVAEKLDVLFYPPFTSMGIEKDGEIVAGIVFNGFVKHDIDVNVAGHGWTRDFLVAAGDYVFKGLDCQRVTLTTSDERVSRLGLRLGGQIEGVLRSHFGPGKDAIIIGILRDEYRFV